MFKWLKLFRKKKQEEIPVPIELDDDKNFDETGSGFLKYKKQLLCKLHQSYSGATEPINDCKICWEIYNEKR